MAHNIPYNGMFSSEETESPATRPTIIQCIHRIDAGGVRYCAPILFHGSNLEHRLENLSVKSA